jgi:hypothetical protein
LFASGEVGSKFSLSSVRLKSDDQPANEFVMRSSVPASENEWVTSSDDDDAWTAYIDKLKLHENNKDIVASLICLIHCLIPNTNHNFTTLFITKIVMKCILLALQFLQLSPAKTVFLLQLQFLEQ